MYATLIRFFDVHVWPAQGRIVMVNADPGSAYGPIGMTVTEIVIRDLIDGYTDPSGVIVIASTFVAGTTGTLIEHDDQGRHWTVHPINFARTAA